MIGQCYSIASGLLDRVCLASGPDSQQSGMLRGDNCCAALVMRA